MMTVHNAVITTATRTVVAMARRLMMHNRRAVVRFGQCCQRPDILLIWTSTSAAPKLLMIRRSVRVAFYRGRFVAVVVVLLLKFRRCFRSGATVE